MNKRWFLLLFIFIGIFLLGCEKEPTAADDELDIDGVLTEQATFGLEVTRIIGSGKEIEDLTKNSQYLEDEGIGDISSRETLKTEALRLWHDATSALTEMNHLAKRGTDSLLIYIDDTIIGKRIALYYNSDNGYARYYEVKYKFPTWRRIVYDSLTIIVDVNFTIFDPSDDMLQDLFREQLFESQYFVQKINSSLMVTHFDGTQITGAEVTKDSYYHPDRFLIHLRQFVDINPEESGTLRDDFEFRDGKTSYRSVTFFPDHTGEFSKQLRDGTTVTGSFNSVEDDLQGTYTETVDFPEGRYVDKIYKSASVSLTLPESIFNAEYEEIIYFSSGRMDSSHVTLESQEVAGNKTTNLTVYKPNGANGEFTIVENEEGSTLVGEWLTWNEYYITINAEYYFDESAHIHYEVFAPPYTPGDKPILVADYYLSPDASGNGTISYKGEIYQISFDGSTELIISSGEKNTRVNLFQ